MKNSSKTAARNERFYKARIERFEKFFQKNDQIAQTNQTAQTLQETAQALQVLSGFERDLDPGTNRSNPIRICSKHCGSFFVIVVFSITEFSITDP